MKLMTGPDARVSRSNPTPYQRGLYFLSQSIEHILTFAFFHGRLSRQLSNALQDGLDREQVRFSRNACDGMIVTGLRSLFERRKDSWSFHQLLKEWRECEATGRNERAVEQAIATLHNDLKPLIDYGNTRLAHKKKAVGERELTAPADSIGFLQETVDLMDMFVTSPIPYTLYLQDSTQDLDLRSLLGLR